MLQLQRLTRNVLLRETAALPAKERGGYFLLRVITSMMKTTRVIRATTKVIAANTTTKVSNIRHHHLSMGQPGYKPPCSCSKAIITSLAKSVKEKTNYPIYKVEPPGKQRPCALGWFCNIDTHGWVIVCGAAPRHHGRRNTNV